MRRRPFETCPSTWVDTNLAAGDYELVVQGTFAGRASCAAQIQLGSDSTWLELPPAKTAGDIERRYVVKIATGTSRLRYQLELGTGGAGTGPTVTAIELHPR